MLAGKSDEQHHGRETCLDDSSTTRKKSGEKGRLNDKIVDEK